MMTLDCTDEKFYKVTHALGFKSLTYPKGLVLKMKDYDSLDAELVPYDSDASPLLGETVYLFNKKEDPKPWSGPEDGLPPVNTECQYWNGGWENCLVIAHLNGRVAFTCPDDTDNERVYIESSPLQHQFKAIKTQKQIAAENRETAIRELMDIAQVDCRVTAARLVDAGFKREVV